MEPENIAPQLHPIGVIRSIIRERGEAPKQGSEAVRPPQILGRSRWSLRSWLQLPAADARSAGDISKLPRDAPDAWLEVSPFAVEGLDGLAAGDDIIVVTWLHLARRDGLKVHPRSDQRNPLTGVFATRSPDRPNPLGLHRVTVRSIDHNRLRIGPIEAIDGTPVLDIKPVLRGPQDL